MTLKISRALHAGYVFESPTTRILFDPIFESPFSVNCFAYPEVRFDYLQISRTHFDAVFISHFHDDHCSLESLRHLDPKTPIFIYCHFEELLELIRSLGFKNVIHLEIDKAVNIGDLKVTAKRALDEDVDSLFHVQFEALNILNVVDSWISPDTLSELAKLAPWDMVMWPFQTMREIEVISPRLHGQTPAEIPVEWREQIMALKPRVLIPSSCQFIHEEWSWYRKAFFATSYQQFEQYIADMKLETSLQRLEPSQSIELSSAEYKVGAKLDWVSVLPTSIPNGLVDYEFVAGLVPPPTSEIAKHFARLESKQQQRVIDYCEFEISDKFGSLTHDEDDYFYSPKYWRLLLFENDGTLMAFDFEICAGRMRRLLKPCTQLHWQTEIPMIKLWNALEEGESLSSLYVRINDCELEAQICAAAERVDIAEDPLLRCLYNGTVASYQTAQLRRIHARQPQK